MNLLTAPLAHDFMQQALLAAVAIAVVCGLLSGFVVLRGWALLSDAVSHAVLPGVVISASLGISIFWGAALAGLVCAFSTELLVQRFRMRSEAILGIVFTSMLAVGMLLYSWLKPSGDMAHILFGNILGISPIVLKRLLWICVAVVCVIGFKWRDLVLLVFDERQMRLLGLAVQRWHKGLLVLLTLAIVVAIEAVGVVLVAALLVAPAMTAQLCCQRFAWLMVVSVLSAVMAAVIGVYVSFYANAATGACIVLTQVGLFMLALIYRYLRMAHLAR